jgi:hypothetical protein
MKIDYASGTVTLELGEVVEVELPSGDSVWVWASGHVLPQKAGTRIDTGRKAPRRKRPPVNGPDPYDPTTDDGTVFHDGLDLPGYGD